MNEATTMELGQRLWDYHRLGHALRRSECILVLGSNDLRVAEYGAQLFLQGWAPLLVVSGGHAHHDDLLATSWGMPEGRKFAEIAIRRGVPEAAVFIEEQARNTGENFRLSWQLLESRGHKPQTFILVQKPYMERRTYATMRCVWPDKAAVVASPPLSFVDYCTPELTQDMIINIMVGDLQRIIEYPKRGFQIAQDVPTDVMQAYQELLRRGFTRHLIR